jgi:hypothetical protein
MQRGDGRIRARACNRAGIVAALVTLGLGAAACTTTGAGVSQTSPRNLSIAFESIDGPPPAVFRRLVQKLTDEAQARQVPVVTREGFAAYRVRGYLAAGLEKKKKRTMISWVWDVYDAGQQRTFRISGEEAVNQAGGDAWALADDAMVGRIARVGMTQIADYLQMPPAPAANPATEPVRSNEDRGVPVASNDDFRPEASGIFRLFTPASAQAAPAAETPAGLAGAATDAGIPLPRERPTGAVREHVALAVTQ